MTREEAQELKDKAKAALDAGMQNVPIEIQRGYHLVLQIPIEDIMLLDEDLSPEESEAFLKELLSA